MTSSRTNRWVKYFVISCTSMLFWNCEHLDLSEEGSNGTQPGLPSTIIADYNFDKEIGDWYERNTCCDWSATLSDTIKRAGAKSVRIELKKGDMVKGSPWSEFGLSPNKNKEEWYAFSVYFPKSFVKDTMEESIVQWQSLPDFAEGETWRSPPLLFGVLNDSLVLEIRSDSRKVNQQGQYTFERLNLGPVEKENWLDWVFRIRWAYDNTGIIEVWKNGTSVLKRINVPNSYNDNMYPYFKIGLYKWGWGQKTKTVTNSRVIYIDEITVGNENSGYDKVFAGHP
jgi:hypothetical protein